MVLHFIFVLKFLDQELILYRYSSCCCCCSCWGNLFNKCL